jgi:very-short-patch-repair endonuclease
MSNLTSLLDRLSHHALELARMLTDSEPIVAEHFLEQRILSVIDDLHGELCDLHTCESPIEQLLFIYLVEEARNRVSSIRIRPQKTFHFGEKTYRADLYLDLFDANRPGIVVECDGHDFHEKTKAQAAKDKSRDRAFQAEGYAIIHFTGSEIWNRPYNCAFEAIDLLLNRSDSKDGDIVG